MSKAACKTKRAYETREEAVALFGLYAVNLILASVNWLISH